MKAVSDWLVPKKRGIRCRRLFATLLSRRVRARLGRGTRLGSRWRSRICLRGRCLVELRSLAPWKITEEPPFRASRRLIKEEPTAHGIVLLMSPRLSGVGDYVR